MTGHFLAALSAEGRKARRSKVPPLTFAVFTVAAGIGALFMFILRDPERARRLGILGQKAQLSGLTADWAGLLGFLAQVIAVGCLLLFAFIVTWVFGREFADGTARYLLALPVSRTTIVLAKFTLITLWALALAGWLIGLVLGVGWLMHLPGWSADVALDGVGSALIAALLMLLAVAPVAVIACLGRGYLAPLGSALGAMVVAQIAAVLGWGALVPWSIPAVAAGLAPDAAVGPASLGIIGLTGLAGLIGTIAWWHSADAGL
ncbi:MAG: ABC transporter permease subunit [Dactylosporangium sp.]|nr:ABC transporter permease [Dactylosporangium sp.]NNJ60506.1 ABC transporter permease subunit [Dactylosporangium sp.]